MTENIPKLSDAKLREGAFIGRQFPEIVNYDLFEHLLMEAEKSVWLTKLLIPTHAHFHRLKFIKNI